MKPLQLLVIVMMTHAINSAHAAPKVITWDDLIPASSNAPKIDFDKFKKPKGMPKLSEFNGSQSELNNFVDSMGYMREMQPQDGDSLAIGLSGRKIKLAGYVTPLSFDGDKVTDFLFVPYLGACVHVPPPPANQIVYVENAKGLNTSQLYEPVWLIGKLKATPVSTLIANVGYTITGAKIEPYTE